MSGGSDILRERYLRKCAIVSALLVRRKGFSRGVVAAAAASAAGGATEDYGHEESAEPPRKRARPAAGAASSSDDAGSFADAAPAEDGGEADGEGAVPEEISFSLNELEGSAAATTLSLIHI